MLHNNKYYCIFYPDFPGMVDEDLSGISLEQAEEKFISAVTRELAEEMNMDYLKHVISKEDYMFSYRHPVKKLYSHFFSFEVNRNK